jgi:major capsid protein E
MNNTLFAQTAQAFLNASAVGQDRLVRKEVSLGFIRQIEPPQDHLGLQLCPFMEVPTDDVIFGYLVGDTDGLAPARAEDAEAELAQKDETSLAEGRASVIDWSLKDHYSASDVNRYREINQVVSQMQAGSIPLFAQSALEDWATKLARDAARRRRKLDNRIEWLIMSALADSVITYNDGKIKFTVDYGRPNAQKAGNAANTTAATGIPGLTAGVVDWSGTTFDPINFIVKVQQYMEDTYGVRMRRALASKNILRSIVNSEKFSQRAGLGPAITAAGANAMPDLRYLLDGWGPDAAVQVVENATGIQFIEYDSVYRTRPIGSNTITNNRFFPQDRLLFLPDDADMQQVDDTQIGFGKTLTSPHPEGNWTPGFYEWEDSTKDPWGQDAGTGVKAFPVFPFMEYTYAVTVDYIP